MPFLLNITAREAERFVRCGSMAQAHDRLPPSLPTEATTPKMTWSAVRSGGPSGCRPGASKLLTSTLAPALQPDFRRRQQDDRVAVGMSRPLFRARLRLVMAAGPPAVPLDRRGTAGA